jgi:alcohol dehydrogenase (cytochrome c)
LLDAYSTKDGKRLWRLWTVPGPGEPGHDTWPGDSWKTGGAPTWVTGTFDPALNLIYWGTGNPAPPFNGDRRPGDNLYTDSLLALEADTGRLKWHFQFTPHDIWDFDSCHVPVLIDAVIQGRMRKLIALANKNSFYYVLDRATGEFLFAKAFAQQSWTDGFDRQGRPRVIPAAVPTDRWTTVRPFLGGSTNWQSPSYSPKTGLFYITVNDFPGVFRKMAQTLVVGEPYWGGAAGAVPGGKAQHAIRALQADTGNVQWDFPVASDVLSGLLSTAGGLVFGATCSRSMQTMVNHSGISRAVDQSTEIR